MSSLKEHVMSKIGRWVDSLHWGDDVYGLFTRRAVNYMVFIFASTEREFREKYRNAVENPIIIGVMEHRNDNKGSLFIAVKKYEEDAWKEFDILADEPVRTVKRELNKILGFVMEHHREISGPLDPKLNEFISSMIDTERRVREGGLLIAAYIKYLQREIGGLEEIIPGGWGGLVLQLMTMYFLHRKSGGKIPEMNYGIISAFDMFKNKARKYDEDGYELWYMLREDLEKFSKISKDSLFSVEEYDLLDRNDFKIENRVFLGSLESMQTFKYENIKRVLNQFSRAIFGSDENFRNMRNKLWKKFEGIGILPLFEVRNWYEGGLIGDVIGGVYEGIKKIEERRRGGIYYTPRFVVEYIVDNTLDPYIRDLLREFGDYEDFGDFVENADLEELEEFYRKLSEIRILDPACGTGHFLVYAMEKLVDYYRLFWVRVRKEKRGNFPVEVIYSNSKTERVTLQLYDIEPSQIAFFIRVHLILKNNVYGVDIDDYAHKIAKARMMIESFWNYDPEMRSDDHTYALPNLEMNIKTGNSLIGFASWDEVPGSERSIGTQMRLDAFFGEEGTYEEIKRLKEEVKRTGRGNVYNEKMKVLRDRTNDAFVEYLRSKGVDIEKEKLGYGPGGLRAFHWIIEFLDVFEGKNPGFDIVVGNPPYGNTERVLTPLEKRVITGLYGLFDEPTSGLTTDVAVLFIYRGLSLVAEGGLLSYIATNKWIRSDYGENIRDFLVKFRIEEIVNFETKMVFPDATAYTAIIRVKNQPADEGHMLRYVPPEGTGPEEKVVKRFEGHLIHQDSLGASAWTLVNPVLLEIKRYIERIGTMMGDFEPKIRFGIKTGYNEAFIIDTETRNRLVGEDPKSAELIKPLLRGKNTGRYYLEWGGEWVIVIPAGYTKERIRKANITEEDFSNLHPSIYRHLSSFKNKSSRGRGIVNRDDQGDFWWELRPCVYYSEFERPKVVWQEIAHRPQFSWDPGVFYGDATTFISVVLGKDKLLVLNSSTVLKYFSTVAPILRGGFFRFKKTYVEKIPLPHYGEEEARSLGVIADYLLQLNATGDLRNEYGDIIRFLDREVADSIVYELYFREKFHEDGLYPEPRNYLLEAVAKHLKPINYDRWAELYWKKQIEGELGEEEEEELERLEEENLKTIEEVYESLKNDEEVQNWIEKIKSHEWVRVIEGEGNNDSELPRGE